MIIKEVHITREDGVKLYRTYSDTDHKIRKVGTNEVYGNAIDELDFEYEEVEDYVELEGASTFDDVVSLQEQISKATRKINRIGLTDKEALSVKEFYPHWEDFIGKTLETGFVVLYNNNLYRLRQTHTVQSDWYPSISTASLFEVIEVEHEGTVEDPIPYTPPMEIFSGKYYNESDHLYLCIMDSGITLSHQLSALVGLYVKIVL